MKTLEISPLTPENFRIFGSYSRLVEPTAPGGGVNGMSFHPDMEILELGGAHAAAFSVTRVTSQLEPVITVLEQHSHCGEGILSLDHDCLLYTSGQTPSQAPQSTQEAASTTALSSMVIAPTGQVSTHAPQATHSLETV